jgi:tetratricopeptide (TPR) repeat protein
MTRSIFGSNAQLKTFLEKNPGSLAFAHLASRMVDDGEYQNAIELCEKGLSTHPSYAFGYFILGTAHYHLKNYTDAKRSLEKSLAYDPNNPRAWEILSAINEILNLSDDARESNMHSYLVDSLREDAASQFIPDVEYSETDEPAIEGDQTVSSGQTADVQDEEKSPEELLDSITTEGDSEFDFDKALDEVFRDKGTAAAANAIEDTTEAEEEEIEAIQEKDLQKSEGMVSADEFTSAIESFFDAHDEEEKEIPESEEDSAEPAGPIQEDSDLSEESSKLEAPDTGESLLDEEEFQEPQGFVQEVPDEPDEFSEIDSVEVDETVSELDEFPPVEEILDDTEDELDDMKPAEEKDTDSEVDETEELLREGLSEEFAAEELIEGEHEEKGPEAVSEEEPSPERQDDELLDFKSFVSDVIADSDTEGEEEAKPSGEPEIESSMESGPEKQSDSAESISETTEPGLPDTETEFPKEEDFDLPDLSSEIPDISDDAIQLEDSKESPDSDETNAKFSRPPILSPTLGEIYIAQGRFEEAVSVFQQLLAKDPQNSRYQRKIDDLKKIIAKKKMES